MHEEMHTLLNAYLDGELDGRRLREMETHLAACAECRDELKELRLVSEILQGDTAVEAMPAERFVSQLTLNLPRLPQITPPQRRISMVWWLVPAGLLGAWFFAQTVFTLTNVVTLANASGILGAATAWLSGGGGQESLWMSAATSLFGGQLLAQPILSMANSISVFGANLLTGFFWQAVIVLLYWAWMFVWWLRRKPQPAMPLNGS